MDLDGLKISNPFLFAGSPLESFKALSIFLIVNFEIMNRFQVQNPFLNKFSNIEISRYCIKRRSLFRCKDKYTDFMK